MLPIYVCYGMAVMFFLVGIVSLIRAISVSGRNKTLEVLLSIASLMVAGLFLAIGLLLTSLYVKSQESSSPAVEEATPTLSPTESITVVSTQILPTPTLVPPTATLPAPTQAILSRADIIKMACLDMSGLNHPNSGKPFIFKLNPYPQDPSNPDSSWVGCEFEAYNATQDLTFILPRGTWMIGVDWYLGYQRNNKGVFTDLCASGPDCEGTFVLGSNDHDVVVTIKMGTQFHGYMYWDGQLAKLEFLGNGSDFSTSFACRYIWYDNKGHTNENIRPAIMPFVSFDHLLVNPEDISIVGHPKNCPLTPQ